MRIQTNPDQREASDSKAAEAAPARRRLSVSERERQIVDGAIQFFASNGFGGQLRDLAKSIGVTHALLYHYFPTKQALIDRVYLDVFEGRWRDSWDQLLDDPAMAVEDKFTAFYADYVNNALSREFVRILMFSGLMDHTITDRFFAMLRERLFPRLIRETRRFRGSTSRARPSERELELLMGLHGGMYYISIRHWIYGQDVHSEAVHDTCDEALVRDHVRSYLMASSALLGAPATTARPGAKRKPAAGKTR
ncbi:TetR/AcrR family transcriptional regulator [Hydrogenophaga sp.]|uniref:TetR/AcrR family transcriptional regulator n=1 Tax=Hydrogenophaga sp. TaxID=1904254 RepID=UPI0025C55283|nr:TetR/AcrR family transcriptional regulator [Hydrogenophaga sp.]